MDVSTTKVKEGYLDYTITWKYICDEMYKRFAVSPYSEEKLTMQEIEAYIDKIWKDYCLEKELEYVKMRRNREEVENGRDS